MISKNYKHIMQSDIVSIDELKSEEGKTESPWHYSFELNTKHRTYVLYAASREERDLWVNGFFRIMGVPVTDSKFKPMTMISRASAHDEVIETEGNNDVGSRINFNKSARNVDSDDTDGSAENANERLSPIEESKGSISAITETVSSPTKSQPVTPKKSFIPSLSGSSSTSKPKIPPAKKSFGPVIDHSDEKQ